MRARAHAAPEVRGHVALALRTALLVLATACVPGVALAQHAGHAGPVSAPAGATRPAAVPDASPVTGHGQATPHAAHPPAAHAAHGARTDLPGASPPPTAPDGPPQPASPAPFAPPTAAERAAAFPDLHGMAMQDHMDDDPVLATLSFDRLERQHGRGGDALAWELQGWVGDLENRLWLRSEGERRGGRVDHGDLELLWGRPTGPWWDVLLGIRHDLGHGPSRDWLALGVQGLAPYKFEVSATAYLGTGGRAALRTEAEYEVLLTNRLILQPRIGANLHARDDPARGTGRGLSDASLGLRLRYEVRRRFAPYAGYEWRRSFGRTADLAQAAGDARSERQWVAGLRFWF